MGWMAPAGIIVPGDGCHACPKEAIRMQISTIGIDLAKRVFQIHGVDQDGNVVLRKQLRQATAVPGRHGGLWDIAPLGARDRNPRP